MLTSTDNNFIFLQYENNKIIQALQLYEYFQKLNEDLKNDK